MTECCDFRDSFRIYCICSLYCVHSFHCAVNIAIICLIILIKIFTKPNLTDIGFQIVTQMTQNISVTMPDRGLVPMNHLQETTHCGSYGHVTDDVTWQRGQGILTT